MSEQPSTVTLRGMAKNLIVVAIFLVFTMVVGVAFSYFGSISVPGGNGAAAATLVTPGATPKVSSPDDDPSTVTVSWTASTLASGRAVTGYVVKRYDAATLTEQTILTACTGIVATTTCIESNLPTGVWRYSVTPSFATNWSGGESAKSATVSTTEKDITPPVNVLTSADVTGGSFKNQNTIYYRGSAAGSFTLTNAPTDAGSGPASSTTQALTGTSTGWTHTPSKISTPKEGPYVSNPFSWVAGTTTSPTVAVVGHDAQDNSVRTTLTFTNDSTAPVATLSFNNGFEAGRSVAVTFSSTDTGSGLATRQLQRSSAPLSSSTGTCGTFTSFARVGPMNPTSVYTDTQVTNATCYKYRYVVKDKVGNETIATSASIGKVDYQGSISATAGLLSQWRLGEEFAASDSFAGTAGALLSSRTGEIGATWTKWANDTPTIVLTDAGRLRRNGIGGVSYQASGVPASADYQVSADVVVKSKIANDYAGVLGRVLLSDTRGLGTRYIARANTSSNRWEVVRVVGGLSTTLGTYSQSLAVGQTYRLALDMRGASIRLLVNGVERISVTDSAIPAAGGGGVQLGSGIIGTSPTNSTGLHLDNVKVNPRAADSKGSNTGNYVNQPTLGVPGAIKGDSDTATAFDGSSEYVQVPNPTGLPVGAAARSVEAWFKTTSSAEQVLFSYGTRATNSEFGLWLEPGGGTLHAWGYNSDKLFTPPEPLNDGAWHQVVTTYDGSLLTVYVDGESLGSQTATRSTVLDAYGFGIGAVITPGDAHSGGYFTGVLDEVSFYTTSLNPAVVSDHYALGTSDPADVAGPTGGSVDASELVGTGSRYSTSTTLSLELAAGTDPSGIADSGAQLLRATATLTSAGGTADGVCGTFGTYTELSGGTDPTSPAVDRVADQACYSYRYAVQDSLGNTTTYTSPSIKVDTTAPGPPTLSYSAFTNAYWSGTGSAVVYYRSAATTGAFTVTAAGSDPKSGVASYAFPALGTNWTSTAGAQGVNTYAWTGTPAAPGTKQVTATNHASLTSDDAPVTLTADNSPPTAGTVTNEASTRATSTSISFTTGSDSGSGVGTRLLQRATATLAGSTCGTFGAFVTVTNGTNPTSPLTNSVTSGNCYRYQYVVADNVGNSSTVSSTTVLKVTSSYADTVSATSGLLNYFRLGETTAGITDSFTGTAGTVLSSRTADSGSSWTRRTGDTITAVLSNQGRLRKATSTGGVGYYATEIPTSADYLVEADLTVKSLVGTAGVLGRGDINGAGTGTYYYARYDAGAGQFQLIKNLNGNAAVISVYSQTLTVGTTYTLGLDMKGSLLRIFVNDVLRTSINDGTITSAGRAGVGFGEPGEAANSSDTAGLHLDNFNVPGVLGDSESGNDGTYVNGPTVGATGPLTEDSDTAATFDGVNDYGTAARQVSDDLSVEFWFSSTQGIGTGSQWYAGAGLVDASVSGAANDFGVSLRSDGKVIAGVGSATSGGDVSITSASGGYADGAWHHVAFTRVKSSGAIKLYVDGELAASGTGVTATLTGQQNISFGRVASGSNFFAGSLDEVAVYDSALSAAVVAGHYAAR